MNTSNAGPIALHPQNPHYFVWRGKPLVLITSGEHYGSVLNADFDWGKYLDLLAADGLNLTRIFTGIYAEANPEKFGESVLAGNTLGPAPGKLLCPFARSAEPGYANGGNKFDLTKWDDAYFRRLRAYADRASQRGIVIEVNLFCPFYQDRQWALSPFNAANNVNGLGRCARTDVYTLDRHAGLLAVQEAMVRRIVADLRDCDNIYYEICNEPYFGGVTMEWQHRIADAIVEAERAFPHKHLISQNIANGKAKVERPHPAVSIFNFHYAWPPDTVALNHGLNKVIGDNETGFKGTADAPYRREAWELILAGGGLFNHLDYSFTVGHEDGTFLLPPNQAGGGSRALRRQLRVLKDFIHGFDFIAMKPDDSVIRSGTITSPMAGGLTQLSARALVEAGKQYAVYVGGGSQVTLSVELPPGAYAAAWLNPRTGQVEKETEFHHEGGKRRLDSPAYVEDIALGIRRQSV